ncbi:MAG: DUF5906 domain-containing protein [Pseudomonadota bacterium]|jgi:hypothetical protein
MIADLSDLSDLPAVWAYLRRIGGEVRSMRTAAVREREGRYLRDRAVIRLSPDGNVAVAPADGENAADFEPTDAERHAIKMEAVVAKWPEVKPCATIRNAPPEIADAPKEAVFEFRDSDGNITMLQVRRETSSGKAYVPWTYWTDGHWRKMEPEGDLPPWGLDQLKDHVTVFLHEGAKAARAMRRLAAAMTPKDKAALAAHPWGALLQHGAHIGWIGGALSPHRTDWPLLGKSGVTKLYIVADRDAPGEAAVPKIAKSLRQYSMTIEAVRFDARFPLGFDLADAFPDKMFRKGRYSGPTFADCVTPATFATRVGQPPAATGRGRPPTAPISLRPEFIAQWIMVIVGGKTMFVDRNNPTRLWSEDEFNTLTRPFSDVQRLSDLFKKQGYEATVPALAYEPGEASRVITVDGVRSVNLYMPPRIRAVAGEVALFEQFLQHLFPDDTDRWQVKRWVATLIACPGIRMRYGLLLASGLQGVGKTTLCEILRRLVGEHNCSVPSAKDVVESQFNGWIVRKRLVFVNEIYEGTAWTAYNKIKSFVTDDTLQANEKFVPGYSINNKAHFALCSNATVALKIEASDRRFLIPAVTETAQSPEFWQRLHDWLDGGGFGIIRHWAETFVARHGNVGPGEVAPETGRKDQLIEDSRAPEERMVLSLAAAARELSVATGQPVVLVDHDVGAWLAQNTKRERPLYVVRDWLKAGGLNVGNDRLKVDGFKRQIAATTDVDGKGWGELKPYRANPAQLLEQEL